MQLCTTLFQWFFKLYTEFVAQSDEKPQRRQTIPKEWPKSAAKCNQCDQKMLDKYSIVNMPASA